MKNDNIELTISFAKGDDKLAVSTGIKKYVNQLLSYKELFPDEVEIVSYNEDGSIFAKVPTNWFRFIHPKMRRKVKE